MSDIILAEDNSDQVKKAAEAAIHRALEIIGGKVENYAKEELTRPKSGHKSGIDPRPNVGSNIFYAPYFSN